MDADFDFNDFDEDFDFTPKNDVENGFIKPQKQLTLKSHQIKFDNAYDLVKRIDLKSKERVFAFVKGNFVMSDFLVSFIHYHDVCAEQMTISTLSFDEYNVSAFAELAEKGYIKKLSLIISDYFFAHERQKAVKYAYDKLNEVCDFNLAVLRSHCKFTTILTDRNNKFIIHGSSNLRSSDNVEQLMIEQDDELYDFCENYNQDIISKFTALQKPLKHKDLYGS